MSGFETPTDLSNNRGLIADPVAFAQERGAESWLYLCGEEFASMEGGIPTRRRRSTSISPGSRSTPSRVSRGRRS